MYCINNLMCVSWYRHPYSVDRDSEYVPSIWYLFRKPAFALISIGSFYFATEIGLYSLYRKKMIQMIAAFELNKKAVGCRCSFPRKDGDLFRILASQAVWQKLYVLCICTSERESVLTTRKSCTAGMHHIISGRFYRPEQTNLVISCFSWSYSRDYSGLCLYLVKIIREISLMTMLLFIFLAFCLSGFVSSSKYNDVQFAGKPATPL